METLILSARDVRRLLPMDECIGVMAEALAALARGEALQPLRPVMWLPGPEPRALGLMPSYVEPLGAVGLKAITVFPGNRGTPSESHQGAVLLFEAGHGRLVAIAEASAITEIRTAAVSGLATRLLAREDAGDLAILGAGAQARSHLEAMAEVRPLRRVRAWSRSHEGAERFAHWAAGRGFAVEAMPSPVEAVDGADLICTVTSSPEPVLLGEWIAPGAHVNAVGACTPRTRELDAPAVARSRLFVDRRESALAEAGDFLLARTEGAIGDDHIAGELGEVLLGQVPARTSAEEITVFESLGLAVEDLAAADVVYRRALEVKRGTWVDFGGGPDEAP
ncbi:MAG: ornithine cyclodeaminase family protein [Candidatus Rokubacteria bacterium]|nr:ornithine cyclodeaminase family protein [Candidatus Rokubacteria bacterium]